MLWLLRAAVAAALLLLVGCTAPAQPGATGGAVAGTAAPKGGSVLGASTPESVTSYLTALRNGDHAGAMATADDSGDAPAGANTAENIFLFVSSGTIRLQDWRLAGVTSADDGGQWTFVVCQILLADGTGREVPLTFHTNKAGKLVFVG